MVGRVSVTAQARGPCDLQHHALHHTFNDHTLLSGIIH